jgi:spore coat polysaccharide biosynthesis protein SpsF (cytidylyltransferase family)
VALRTRVPAAVQRPELRFTIDTPDDLAFMRDVIERAEAVWTPPVPLASLIAVAEDRLLAHE